MVNSEFIHIVVSRRSSQWPSDSPVKACGSTRVSVNPW